MAEGRNLPVLIIKRCFVAQLTLTLHKFLSSSICDMCERVAFSGQMLDARYLMLDIQECTWNEIQKHPVSSLPGRSSGRAKT